MSSPKTSKLALALVAGLSALVVVGAYEIPARLSKRRVQPVATEPESESQVPPGVRHLPLAFGSAINCAALRSRYVAQCPTGEVLPSVGVNAARDGAAPEVISPEREKQEISLAAEWVKPSQDALADMATRCEIRFVSPAIMDSQTPIVDDQQAAALSLTGDDRAELDQTLQLMREQFAASVRPLFNQATLPPSLDDMMTELQSRRNSGFVEARRKLSQEKAGLVAPPPPAARAQLPAGERFLRLWDGLGDEFEQRLASKLGAARAHQLRFSPHSTAWTSRYVYSGCPSAE